MISVSIRHKNQQDAEETFVSLFQFKNLQIPASDISAYLATMVLGRVRKRFMKQENPDGSRWPISRSAKIRMGGGYTYAKGGPYAPGGFKTGGNTLFSSGNLFHSIRMLSREPGTNVVMSDVPYAVKYMNKDRTIIGTTEAEVDILGRDILRRLI